MNPFDPEQTPIFSALQTPSEFSGKLIVSVHGMGDQTRNDFAQTVARLFSRYFALKVPDVEQTRLLPLGAWDGGRETDVDDPAVCFAPAHGCEGLKDFAFAEVYWADIARTMEKAEYRLEEPTHWARTVVERLAQRHGNSAELGPKQFHLAGFVLEEIAETLALLQKVAMAGHLFSISKNDLDMVLTRYLCDVQQVGDFKRQREKIRDRFLNRLEALHDMYPKAEIHIIAHSEGSAVSLFSLLAGLCEEGRKEVDERRGRVSHAQPMELTKQASEATLAEILKLVNSTLRETKKPKALTWKWLDNLASFTTMGSPIDKHIHLWPEMWRTFEASPGWIERKSPIRWRNYYDYGDPVGYELDSAQVKLAQWNCMAFDFDVTKHDHGYRRYLIPGKAHLGYFTDDVLFAHVIEDAIQNKSTAVVPESNLVGRLSPIVPFALVAGLIFGAVFVFQRGLLPPDCKEWVCTSFESHTVPGNHTNGLLGCWALLVGMTVLARILRLTRTVGMLFLSAAVFGVGAGLFWLYPGNIGLEAGLPASRAILGTAAETSTLLAVSKILVIALALIGVCIAWLADFVACVYRWRPVWALRIFILTGTLAMGWLFVIPRLSCECGPSASAMLGGLGGFAVLWWLGALLFDLSFCWQRYINCEKSWMDRLWKGRDEAAKQAASSMQKKTSAA